MCWCAIAKTARIIYIGLSVCARALWRARKSTVIGRRSVVCACVVLYSPPPPPPPQQQQQHPDQRSHHGPTEMRAPIFAHSLRTRVIVVVRGCGWRNFIVIEFPCCIYAGKCVVICVPFINRRRHFRVPAHGVQFEPQFMSIITRRMSGRACLSIRADSIINSRALYDALAVVANTHTMSDGSGHTCARDVMTDVTQINAATRRDPDQSQSQRRTSNVIRSLFALLNIIQSARRRRPERMLYYCSEWQSLPLCLQQRCVFTRRN